MANATKALTTLQSLILPEPGICTERGLYIHLHGPAFLSTNDKAIYFDDAGSADFGTYFNLFNVGKWKNHCGLKNLQLELRGEGQFFVSVMLVRHNRSWERLDETVTLKKDEAQTLDVTELLENPGRSLLFFEIKARGEAVLTGASWKTFQQPLRTPNLFLSITTFRREEAVHRSVRRFESFIETSHLKGNIQLIVVDNGKSAELQTSQYVVPVENENLGGAGGFTRGLMEAKSRGGTHCLFMDDDATIHMQSLERTWTFLAYAIDPKTCVAGALTHGLHKWLMWENGALFDRHCIRVNRDCDLRAADQVFEMEFDSTRTDVPQNFYGGWWYFAFPIDEVEYLPFPFFVRGDDVSFGLAHDFNSVTLPGVVTFQDEDFSNKETAQTLYLDLRSHLAHHLSIPHMEIGRWRTCRIATWFFMKSLVACHYETLEALNMAFEDVMEGPDFFERNIDMSQRRADIKALMQNEAMRPIDGRLPAITSDENNLSRVSAIVLRLLLNGHLIPFFGAFGRHVVVRADDRWQFYRIWGASQITYVDKDSHQAYTVTHSKAKALKQGGRLLRNSMRFLRSYPEIKERWRTGYRQMTTEDFWIDKLKLR